MAGSRLEGCRVFITGAGQGIGRAIAIAAAREGAIVHATSRTVEKLADLPAVAPRLTTARLDVTDGPALEAAISAAGEIDVLVNAAAGSMPARFSNARRRTGPRASSAMQRRSTGPSGPYCQA